MSTYFLYVGTYDKGIYGYRYHTDTGKLDSLGIVGEVGAPSFLASDRDYKHLYAVSEVEHGDGAVAGFAINRQTGALTALNSLSSKGTSPCHLAVDHTGKLLVAANYGTGSVPVYPLAADGKLCEMSGFLTATGSSADPSRQKGPHAHQTVFSSDNRFVYVPDLGLDQIRIYRVDPMKAQLTPNDPPFAKQEPGYGPRHMVLSHNGKFAYVLNELKSFVTVYTRDASTGALQSIQSVSTLPEGFSGENAPAELLLDRAGKHLYASNRGPGSIAVFSIDGSSGKIQQVQVAETGGTVPRGVEIDPSGKFLFAGDQKGDRFVSFKIDSSSGKLTLSGDSYQVPTPVAFYFVPTK